MSATASEAARQARASQKGEGAGARKEDHEMLLSLPFSASFCIPRTGEGTARSAACVRLKLNVFVACGEMATNESWAWEIDCASIHVEIAIMCKITPEITHLQRYFVEKKQVFHRAPTWDVAGFMCWSAWQRAQTLRHKRSVARSSPEHVLAAPCLVLKCVT